MARLPRFVISGQRCNDPKVGGFASRSSELSGCGHRGATKVIELAFEPFGARRSSGLLTNISTTEMTNVLAKADVLNSQGYTEHESLDRTGLIHMNGRVYDPQLARFISPDPIVHDPRNSQSWNRYSYVSNNPLKYTDPTGFEQVCKEQQACKDEMVVTGRKEPSYDGGQAGDRGLLDTLGRDSTNNFFIPSASENKILLGSSGNLSEIPAATAGIGAACEYAGNITCRMSDAATPPEGLRENEDGVITFNGQPVAMGMAPNPRVVIAAVGVAASKIAVNINRFMKKIPANSKDKIERHELPNGGIAIQATSPGKVPGSKAVYEKQIDQNGVTVQATKTTYDPLGNIVHVKDKLIP